MSFIYRNLCKEKIMKNDIRLGIILMLSATLFFAIMDGVSRYLAETYNVMVINMLRAWVLAFIVILISMRKGKGIKKVSISGNYFLQIIRGVILITCVCIGVYSFTILGLVTSHCIISCYPLVVIALSGPFLKEKVPSPVLFPLLKSPSYFSPLK